MSGTITTAELKAIIEADDAGTLAAIYVVDPGVARRLRNLEFFALEGKINIFQWVLICPTLVFEEAYLIDLAATLLNNKLFDFYFVLMDLRPALKGAALPLGTIAMADLIENATIEQCQILADQGFNFRAREVFGIAMFKRAMKQGNVGKLELLKAQGLSENPLFQGDIWYTQAVAHTVTREAATWYLREHPGIERVYDFDKDALVHSLTATEAFPFSPNANFVLFEYYRDAWRAFSGDMKGKIEQRLLFALITLFQKFRYIPNSTAIVNLGLPMNVPYKGTTPLIEAAKYQGSNELNAMFQQRADLNLCVEANNPQKFISPVSVLMTESDWLAKDKFDYLIRNGGGKRVEAYIGEIGQFPELAFSHAEVRTVIKEELACSDFDLYKSLFAGGNVLHIACEKGDVVQVGGLLDRLSRYTDRRKAINQADSNGITPAMLATKHPALFEYLSELGEIDFNALSTNGRTVLNYATQKTDSIEVIKSVLAASSTAIKKTGGGGLGVPTALYSAAERGLDEVMACLVSGPDIDVDVDKRFVGLTPLAAACRSGHDFTAERLLEHGADPDYCCSQIFNEFFPPGLYKRATSIRVQVSDALDKFTSGNGDLELLFPGTTERLTHFKAKLVAESDARKARWGRRSGLLQAALVMADITKARDERARSLRGVAGPS